MTTEAEALETLSDLAGKDLLSARTTPREPDPDAIDRWHEGGTGVPLWEYLGMTREDYGRWVENGGDGDDNRLGG